MTDHFVWVRQMACWMFAFDFLIFESSQHPRQVSNLLSEKPHVTRTWFEHATFWTGVRRATFAPPGLLSIEKIVTVLYLKFYRVYHVSGRHVCAHSKEHEIWTKTGPKTTSRTRQMLLKIIYSNVIWPSSRPKNTKNLNFWFFATLIGPKCTIFSL